MLHVVLLQMLIVLLYSRRCTLFPAIMINKHIMDTHAYNHSVILFVRQLWHFVLGSEKPLCHNHSTPTQKKKKMVTWDGELSVVAGIDLCQQISQSRHCWQQCESFSILGRSQQRTRVGVCVWVCELESWPRCVENLWVGVCVWCDVDVVSWWSSTLRSGAGEWRRRLAVWDEW